ncbi:MAG TPA: alpha/beta hydrolase [Candidatus Limnocylindrales bacterium]|jgi:pimeloyl-ACP methyl ester carboxylesterase|nr:alpha/beta hydrolase [Candidatus Limnocylindrales bacterium]
MADGPDRMALTHIEVPGGRLQVADDGAGPPIVLLHAGVADLRAWDPLVPPLVAAGYRAVRPDTRGYGGSTTEDVGFSLEADLVAVLDALGIRRAALVGNSRGGMTAFDTAIAFPDRVVAVVGVGSGLGGFDGGGTPQEMAINEEYERVDSADPFDADALTEFEAGVWLDGPGQRSGRVDAAVRAAFIEMARPLNEPGRVRGQRIALDPPANDRLAELHCPVLAIAGGLDFSEVTATAERIASIAPDARAEVWPDVAHMIGMERPDRLAASIIDFLAPLDRWA